MDAVTDQLTGVGQRSCYANPSLPSHFLTIAAFTFAMLEMELRVLPTPGVTSPLLQLLPHEDRPAQTTEKPAAVKFKILMLPFLRLSWTQRSQCQEGPGLTVGTKKGPRKQSRVMEGT